MTIPFSTTLPQARLDYRTTPQPHIPNSPPGQVFKQFNLAQTAKKTLNSDTLLGGRTKGMWMFDSLLYPILTNTAVFVISVLATYATTYGGPRNFMRLRGDWARQKLQDWFKMAPQTAKETIMISFSFLDGCVMAPVVKLFEDRRMKISEKFDAWLGTTPTDRSVYDKEPKQTWASVLIGRTTAFALVLPTAKLLSKKIRGHHSMNELLFAKPGQQIGKWLLKTFPSVQRRFPRLNFVGLAEVAVLEAFYTSLCTAGLYFSSRFIARQSE